MKKQELMPAYKPKLLKMLQIQTIMQAKKLMILRLQNGTISLPS